MAQTKSTYSNSGTKRKNDWENEDHHKKKSRTSNKTQDNTHNVLPQPTSSASPGILFQINFAKLFLNDAEAIALFRTNRQNYLHHYSKYTLKQYYAAKRILPVWLKPCMNQPIHSIKPVLQKCKDIESLAELELLLSSIATITHLGFGGTFDQSLQCPYVSKCIITHLNFGSSFGSRFNQSVDNNFPFTLTHLTLSGDFNQPVNQLPSTLTHLKFGWQFNQSVDHLPADLTHLTFGEQFNQPVNHLSASLTHLTFGHQFNQSVDCLPAGLTHLTFNPKFYHSIKHLPSSLTHLTVGAHFNQQHIRKHLSSTLSLTFKSYREI